MQAATVMIQSALPSIDTQLEERLRRASQTGSIRFSEFFKDFDPLKSGVITSRLPASSFARHNYLLVLLRNAVLSMFGPAFECATE